jgi:anaerobic ribonucleoside-triphosphate reductase
MQELLASYRCIYGMLYHKYYQVDSMEEDHEKLKKTSVYLEEEVLEALEEAALKLEEETGMKWSKGAVIRLALSDFFTRRGKML